MLVGAFALSRERRCPARGCADGRGGVAVRPGLCRRGGAVAPDRRLAGDLRALVVALPLTLAATWLAAPAGWPAISGAAWLSLVYVSVFSMWIGFIFWYRGSAQGGIAAVGQLQLLQPFFGLALAGWLLHETVQPMMIAVMAGVVVCVFGAKRFPARRRCRRRPDHLSEPFHRLLHLAVGVTAQSQHQTRLTVAGRIHRRHRPQRQSGFVGALGDPHVIEIFPQPQHHVHALIAGLHDRQLSGDMRVDRLDQHPAFLGVDAAHFADMPVEIPFGDKGGQHVLIRAGRMAIHQDPGAAKASTSGGGTTA